LLLHALVTSADVQDRDGGLMVLSTLFGQFPVLKRLFADSAYTGPVFHDGLANALPSLVTEIVRRCDQARGFVVLPKRWIVERTIGWLGRCRRLAKALRGLTPYEFICKAWTKEPERFSSTRHTTLRD
jgi:transposase